MKVVDELRPMALFSKLQSIFNGGVARLHLFIEGSVLRFISGDFVMKRFVGFAEKQLRGEVKEFGIALLYVNRTVDRFTKCCDESDKNSPVSF